MKHLGWWIRNVCALLILVSLVTRYTIGLETFELRWVESGFFNWLMVPFAIRIVAFYEAFVIAMLVLSPFSFTKIRWWVAVLLVIYGVDGAAGWSNDITSNFPFFYYTSFALSLFALVTLVVMAASLTVITDNKPPFSAKPIVIGSLTLALCGGVFAMNHLTANDFSAATKKHAVASANWSLFFEELRIQNKSFSENDSFLIAFFSTHCEVCHWNAMKIKAALDYYGNHQQVILVFFEPQEDIDFFLTATKIQAPYLLLPSSSVLQLVGDGFPALCKVEKGNVVNNLSPNEFNYYELHTAFK